MIISKLLYLELARLRGRHGKKILTRIILRVFVYPNKKQYTEINIGTTAFTLKLQIQLVALNIK